MIPYDIPYQIITFISQYFSSFFSWLESLTPFEILLILAITILADLGRNVGKTIILGADALNRHFKPPKYDKTIHPRISILLPAHNEGFAIRKTIASLLENPYPNKEIIVIDDHSSDNTYDLALPFADKGLIKLVKRTWGVGSKAAAINYGAIFATGDYLMVMDGDTLIERTALSEVVKQLSVPGVTAASGNVRILSGDNGITNILTKLQAYEYMIAFELGRRYNAIMKMLIIVPGAFGVFPNQLGKKVGLFDRDTIGEDFDLTVKLLKTGGRISFVPSAVAWTYCPSTWKAWFRQRVRWAHGQFSTLVKHGDVFHQNKAYKREFVAGVYDMVIMDIGFLFLKTAGIIALALFYNNSIMFIYTLVFMLYFANEAIAIGTAALLSPRKSDLKYVYLIPLVLLFYRPLYSYVRLYGYLRRLLNRDTPW